jgi:hypothetical protein
MEPIAAVLFLTACVLIGAVAVGLRMLGVARKESASPDTPYELRAGDNGRFDREAAASRARGMTSWMRPDGGGF